MSANKLTNDTLLGMAKNNLTVAKEMYKLYPDDNGIVNLVAYHLQQTIELALKHFFKPTASDTTAPTTSAICVPKSQISTTICSVT